MNTIVKKIVVTIGLCMYALHIYAQPAGNNNGVDIKPSPKGVYLLLSDKAIHTIPDLRGVSISRTVNDGKATELGTLKPASTIAEFEQRISKDALLDIAKIKKLSSKEDAFAYTQQHPSLKDYGLLAMNLDLGVALGAYYLDNNIAGLNKGDKVSYSINFNGKESKTIVTSIIYGQMPAIQKPILYNKLISDSLIELSWTLLRRNSPDVMFGNVYVQEGSPAPYQKAGSTMAVNSSSGDSVILRWTQETKKNVCYSFFIVPTTIAFYEGIASDTSAIISLKENNTEQATGLVAKDTSNGIFLSWNIPSNLGPQRLWLLQRTHEVSKPYINIAMLDPRKSSYLDHEVLPSEQYYYRIRTITLNGDTLSPSSHSSARHEYAVVSPTMPENITATTAKNGVQIRWNKVNMPDVIGYYVYRSITEDNKMELLSLLLKDTTYIDTMPMHGRNRYIYGVRAFTGGNMMGYLGTSSVYIPTNTLKPTPPTGLVYYVQKGNVHLSWDDASLRDKAVTGYKIYRKSGGALNIDLNNPTRSGFTLAYSTTSLDWDDVTANGGLQSYALTTLDQYGNESEVGQLVSVATEQPHITVPENFSVRKTSKGVAIEWDIAANTEDDTYIIYRRDANETTATKIASTPANKLQYIDSTAKVNTIYYYSLESKRSIGTSERSEEKVVKN